MSSQYEAFGITEKDKQKLTHIRDARDKHGQHSTHQPKYPDKPELPLIDGERQVAELRGNKTTKVHRPHPEREGVFPWCARKAGGYRVDSSPNEWKFRRLGVAREWRSACLVCFPEGYDE